MNKGYFFGIKSLGNWDKDEGDEVGGEPVGLAQSRENAILDVLDPFICIYTKMLRYSPKGNKYSSTKC